MKKFNVLSVVLGSSISMCSLLLFEFLFAAFFYDGPSLEILNTGLSEHAILSLSNSYYLVLSLSNALVSFVAGMIPVVIGDEELEFSIFIGIIVSLFSIINNFIIPFPFWYSAFSLPIYIPFTFLGGYTLKNIFSRHFSGIKL